jgi:hypothetical protein
MMRLFVSTFAALALVHAPSAVFGAEVNELGQESYPIDSSWAIKSDKLASTFGDKQKLYDDYMAGCREMAGEKKWACDDSYRIQMNRDQPRVSQTLDGRRVGVILVLAGVTDIMFVGRAFPSPLVWVVFLRLCVTDICSLRSSPSHPSCLLLYFLAFPSSSVHDELHPHGIQKDQSSAQSLQLDQKLLGGQSG